MATGRRKSGEHWGTTPTQVRLTETDKAQIEAIRQALSLPTTAAAIRHAIAWRFESLGPAAKPGPKKNLKGA